MTRSSRTRSKPAAKKTKAPGNAGRAARPAKAPAKTARVDRASLPVKRVAAAKSAGGSARRIVKHAGSSAREKKFVAIFGPVLSKVALNCQDKSCPVLTPAADEGVCILQFSQRPDRMSWVSVTQGLAEQGKAHHTELLVHWRARDAKLPVKVLAQVARYALETGAPLTPGAVLAATDEKPLNCGIASLPHWLICPPDQLVADQAKDGVKLALVIGITDGELQFALKVRPEVADGRKVLFEALRIGQVYPVTDPGRTCLTRRRDFHRIWESAFQLVRGGK